MSQYVQGCDILKGIEINRMLVATFSSRNADWRCKCHLTFYRVDAEYIDVKNENYPCHLQDRLLQSLNFTVDSGSNQLHCILRNKTELQAQRQR